MTHFEEDLEEDYLDEYLEADPRLNLQFGFMPLWVFIGEAVLCSG